MKTRPDEVEFFCNHFLQHFYRISTSEFGFLVSYIHRKFGMPYLFFKVRNTAGGFVFPVSDETRVRRFIILGTSGGTYYSTEKELTMDNIKALIDIIEKGE